MTSEKWLTLSQAAEYLGLSQRGVRKLGQDDVLERKVGQLVGAYRRPFVYSLASCDQYLAARRPPDGHVSVADAAEALGVNITTIARWAREGNIEAIRGDVGSRGKRPWWVKAYWGVDDD